MKINKLFNFILTLPGLLALNELEQSPPVSLKIKTQWNQNALSLELLELLSEQYPTQYYLILENLFKNIVLENDNKETNQNFYELNFKKLKNLNILEKELNWELINFGLSLKLSSSKIETKLNYFNSYILPNIKNFNNCNNWIQVNDLQFCKLNELKDWINDKDINDLENDQLLPFDKVYPSKSSSTNQFNLFYYTNFDDKSFEFYKELLDFVESKPGVSFVLRYQTPFDDQSTSDKVELSGYGAYLDLKNTEYKVQDDRYEKRNSKDKGKSKSSENSEVNEIPIEYQNIWNEELKKYQSNVQPIKKYENEELDKFNQKFTQLIQGSENPLNTWVYLLQNLPLHASTILNTTLKESHCEGISMGRNFFFQQPLPDTILINGISIDLAQLDVFNLFKFLNLEFNTLNYFNSLGLTNSESLKVLKGEVESTEEETSDENKAAWDNVFDVRDKFDGEDGKVVIWLNDIEEEDLYKEWPTEISSLHSYMYGYLPQTQKNYANAIFPLNLNQPNDLTTLVKKIIQFSSNPVAIRFGFVTLIDDNNEDSKKVANIIHYLFDQLTRDELKEYLNKVVDSISDDDSIIIEPFKKHYSKLQKDHSNLELSFNDIVSLDDEKYIHPTSKYIQRLQLSTKEDVLFVNGKRVDYEGNFQKPLVQSIFEQIPVLIDWARNGEIDEKTNIYNYWLDQSPVLKSYNPLLNEDRFDTTLNLISWIQPQDHSPLNDIKFIQSESSDEEKSEDLLTTAWLFGNFDKTSDLKVLENTIEYLKSNSNVRISIIPTNIESEESDLIYSLLINSDQLKDVPSSIDQLKKFKFSKAPSKKSEARDYFKLVHTHFNSIVSLNTKDNFRLVVDAKQLTISSNELKFLNLKSIIEFYKSKFQSDLVKKLKFNLNNYSNLDKIEESNLLIQVQSILNFNQITHQSLVRFGSFDGGRTNLPTFDKPECSLELNKNQDIDSEENNEHIWAKIEFILDPLGENAAKWSSILSAISHFKGVQLKGSISPNSDAESFKKTHLNRFYRFLLPTKLNFNESNGKLNSPKVQFSDLPQNALLTLGLDTVPSWVVSASDSSHDLDNLKLQSLPLTGTHPEFELKHILVEGHCTDLDRRPPRGLEFNLGYKNHPNVVDTIVMANLGYFQFKANPGVWEMRIRPGKSDQVYEIVNIGDQGHSNSGKHVDERRTLVVDSLGGIILFPKVKKRKGMESVDLLNDEEDQEEQKKPKNNGVWDSLFGSSKPSAPKSTTPNPHGDINVFTVASGHLYERFMSVMVASVMKNTDRKVKFWFIENFLSPSFKKFIPKLSQRYNFTYQMVTYQWPHWLNLPSEKQRVIWGYKILFLDVLFPLDLDKVIFVDADQSVRADLGELVDMDLDGKPYGYVPFCTSRESMKGYRFWEQGYWKSHLGGKPYHISALYVVDLKRFRAQAAGDILRSQYQMLSQDPNSLANLDQDLPNHLQHELPIFSLPQEWLWCETWCDDGSLKKAKTIDLCNNPETKEPKLDRARRILPEWEGLDKEVRALDEDEVTPPEAQPEKDSSDEDEEL